MAPGNLADCINRLLSSWGFCGAHLGTMRSTSLLMLIAHFSLVSVYCLWAHTRTIPLCIIACSHGFDVQPSFSQHSLCALPSQQLHVLAFDYFVKVEPLSLSVMKLSTGMSVSPVVAVETQTRRCCNSVSRQCVRDIMLVDRNCMRMHFIGLKWSVPTRLKLVIVGHGHLVCCVLAASEQYFFANTPSK